MAANNIFVVQKKFSEIDTNGPLFYKTRLGGG